MTSPPKRVLLLTHARTASHLIERMLSAQPNTIYASAPFGTSSPLLMKAVSVPYSSDDPPEIYQELAKAQQDAFTNVWEPFFENAAQDGKIAFMHTHSHFSLQPALVCAYVHGDGDPGRHERVVLKSATGDDKHSQDNPEILPDAELLASGTVPVFTIRHPALMIPSLYRTLHDMVKFQAFEAPSDEVVKFTCTLRWQRLLYEWYARHGPAHGVKPIIVDADDFQGLHHREFMARLCAEIGLDGDSVLYEWPKASAEQLDAPPDFVIEIQRSILGSDGVIPRLDSQSRDLEADEASWVQTFGQAGAERIKQLVEKAMPDYAYLKERKFK